MQHYYVSHDLLEFCNLACSGTARNDADKRLKCFRFQEFSDG